jgi:sugar lactone lactonase YvrE
LLLQGRGSHAPAVNKVNLSSMRSEVLLDSYQGKQFNSPNDVVIYRDGSIWFTGGTANSVTGSLHGDHDVVCMAGPL